MNELVPGSPAPALSVTLDDGTALPLAKLYAKGPLLVYFYPKSATPGCTRQACNLRDNFALLGEKGLQVLGVSRDTVRAQTAFRQKQTLPFRLVCDGAGALGEAFGVSRPAGRGYARQSFLIVNGVVAWVQKKAKPDTQAADALKALETIRPR